VKIWVAFLLITLFFAGRSARKQRPSRDILLLGGCFVAAVVLSTYRFV
jgi:hypothetical protein